MSVNRGQTTGTSRAVSLPPVQLRMKISAGLALVPGRRAFSSFIWGQVRGGSHLVDGISGYPLPMDLHAIAWSPYLSSSFLQAGQGPMEGKMGAPSKGKSM